MAVRSTFGEPAGFPTRRASHFGRFPPWRITPRPKCLGLPKPNEVVVTNELYLVYPEHLAGDLADQASRRLQTVEVLGSRALRSMAFGLAAVAVAWVAGFVFSGLQNPLLVAAVFALVVTVAMVGLGRIAQWLRPHARLSFVAVAVVETVLVLYLVSPTYITPP